MVDTNVLIDALQGQQPWFGWSIDQLSDARRSGALAVSAIVVGELAMRNMPFDVLRSAIGDFGIAVRDLGSEAAFVAGRAQRAYRDAGGRREHLLGDFLIGGHADAAGATLITRDPRRYRRYFPDLPLITPETEHG